MTFSNFLNTTEIIVHKRIKALGVGEDNRDTHDPSDSGNDRVVYGVVV